MLNHKVTYLPTWSQTDDDVLTSLDFVSVNQGGFSLVGQQRHEPKK